MKHILAPLALLCVTATSSLAAPPPSAAKAPGAASPQSSPTRPTDPVEACMAVADTQLAMNDCAALDLKLADAALAQAITDANERGDVEARKLISAAVASFTGFRDKVCEVEADAFRGGSMAPLIRSSCRASWTHRFIESLKPPEEGAAPQ